MRLKSFDNFILTLLLVIPLTSCQALLIEPEDSAARTTAANGTRARSNPDTAGPF